MALKIKFFSRSEKSNPINIKVRVANGKQYDLTALTGISINSGFWNNESGTLRQRAEITQDFKTEFNQRLNDIEAAIRKVCNKLTAPDKLTIEQLKTIIDKVNNPERYKEPELKTMSLMEFIQHFIDTAGTRINTDTNAPISSRTKQEYQYSFDYLKKFADTRAGSLDFNDIDYEFYKDYIDFLRKCNLNNNTIGKRVKTLKTFLNAATETGENTNTKFKSKKFKVFKEESDNIYLTDEELTAFYNYDLSKKPHQEKVRDLFIVACYTGLRYSDINKVNKDHINDGILTLTQQKTGNKIYIPLHLTVWNILNKYNNLLPKVISNQKFNEFLKEAAKGSEVLNAEFIKATTKQGLRYEKTYIKSDLISSHTARRTFCTNEYLKGTPTITIMAISGHKTETAFLKYIKVDKEDHAKKMLDIWRNRGEFMTRKAN